MGRTWNKCQTNNTNISNWLVFWNLEPIQLVTYDYNVVFHSKPHTPKLIHWIHKT